MIKQTRKRGLALALCLALGLTLLPAPALAAELPEEPEVQTEAAQGTGAEEEAASSADTAAEPDSAQEQAEENAPEAAQPTEEAPAETDPADAGDADAAAESSAATSPEEEERPAETEWVEVNDPTEVTAFVWDNWSDDYFEEAVVDPKRERVTVDGEKTTVEDAFGAEAAEADILDSVSAAEDYFDETPYEAEKQRDGTVTVTAPYQTCRIVVNASSLVEDYGAETILVYEEYDEYVLQFSDEEATQSAYEKISARYGSSCYLDEVFSAEEALTEDGSDSYTAYSWGADYMGMTELKNSATVSGAVTVAILDTGCDTDNWFFEGRTFSEKSYDFSNETAGTAGMVDSAGTSTGHGTHVAGIVTDCTPENVELMILRVFDDNGKCVQSVAQNALRYALENGADVINLSLGGYLSDSTMAAWEKILQTAPEKGATVVCAAGNVTTNGHEVTYPGTSEYTVTVSNLTRSEALASSSCYGTAVDFCAPGSSIVSAKNGGAAGETKTMSGTSMAAPHVTAAFAWLRLLHPEASSEEIYQLAKDCAVDLGETGKDEQFGWGYLYLGNEPEITCMLSRKSYTYTGEACTPAVAVEMDGETLTEGTDYTLSYADNVEPGTASVTVTVPVEGESAVKRTLFFTIRKRQPVVSVSPSRVTLYVGESTQLQVSTKSEGALFYDTDDSEIADVDENGLVTAAGAGTTTITVTAEESDHDEEVYDTVEVTVKLLDTPELTAGANTAKGIQVKWKAVENAARYRVFRKTANGWKRLGDTVSASWTDTTAKAGTTYTYTVRCVTSDGAHYASSYSRTGITARRLLAPKVTLSNGRSGIAVKWSKSAGADSYDLYRRTGSGSWKKLKSGVSSASYTDTGAVNGRTYSYRVVARNRKTGSVSRYSSAGTLYRLGGSSVTRVKNKAKRKLCLQWQRSSSASGYQVQYGVCSDFSGAKTVTVKSGSKHCKTLTNLKKGKRYYVRVRCYRTVSGKKVYSAWSTVKSLKITK